jgi:hypothetical protein
MATDVPAAAQYRELLADHLEETAGWRRAKAEQHPEDERNANSAQALDLAAEYVRGLPDDHRALRPFEAFDAELYEWNGLDPAAIFAAVEERREASKFRFARGAYSKPTTRDVDALVLKVYEETLRGWRDAIGISQPPGTLVKLFEEHGVPLWDEDGGDDAEG